MNRKLSAAVLSMFVAAVAAAQIAAPVPRIDPDLPRVLCPHPIVLDIQGEKSAPTQDPADLPASVIPVTHGSQWNQTAIDKAFGDTFHFPMEKQCCAWTKGTLAIEVKALQGGAAGSHTSVNDAVSVYSNKVLVPPEVSPWTGGVSTGATKTLTWNLPASALALGRVSIYVEDDTAVVWAHLHLEGCCIR